MSAWIRVLRRSGAAAVLAALAVPLGAGVAAAHVTVDGGGARQGAPDAVLTFRVPNERTGATTVSVDVKLPSVTPIASVKAAPKPGWTVTTRRVTFASPIVTDDGTLTEGVGEVVWTATSPAAGIPQGGFDTFELLVGPLPDGVATLAFPTVQTYSNGQVSSWIQPVTPGSEPSDPAPVLTLAAAGEAAGGSAGAATAAGAGPGSASAVSPGQVRTARLLGVVGVVTGSLGLLGAGYAIGRTRRPEPGPAPDGPAPAA